MSKRILVTGGSGLFALNLAQSERERSEIVLGVHSRLVAVPGTRSVGLPDGGPQLEQEIGRLKPDLVVHTAGMTSVELCEKHPDEAHAVHVGLSRNLAMSCRALGIPMVHISTDHLFDGSHACLDESAVVKPRNVYGMTKALAETAVLETHPDALVVRTNFYGWGPSYRRSFSDSIISALRGGQTITLFRDVFYTPILVESAVTAIMDLCKQGAHGVLHVVGDERVSKLEFGLALAREFKLPIELIHSGSILEHSSLVRRPMDMSLSNHRVRTLLGRKLGSVAEHLQRLHQQERDGLARELQSL